MIRGAMFAILASLILNLIVPAIFGVILTTLFSGLTLLDPLYAGDRNTTAWFTLMMTLVFQTLHTFITAPVTGILTALIHKRIQSGWLYLIGVALTVILHYIFLLIFAGISSFFVSEDISIARTVSFFLIIFISPLIGLITVFAVRRAKK